MVGVTLLVVDEGDSGVVSGVSGGWWCRLVWGGGAMPYMVKQG